MTHFAMNVIQIMTAYRAYFIRQGECFNLSAEKGPPVAQCRSIIGQNSEYEYEVTVQGIIVSAHELKCPMSFTRPNI